MRRAAGTRVTAVRVLLLLQAVLLLDLALRSIPRLASWQTIDDARRFSAVVAGKPVDHTYMVFFPNSVLHFDITLVQFGYLNIALPATMAVLFLLLTLRSRAFSNRARLTTAIVEAVLVLVAVVTSIATGGLDPLLLALAAVALIAVLAPGPRNWHAYPFAPA